MPVELNQYIEISNMNEAHSLALEIAQRVSLQLRSAAKNYGEIKESDMYSDKHEDWSQLSVNFLKNRRDNLNPMYSLWNGIKQRCYNPNSISYAYYGGSGIGMFQDWKEDFGKFAVYVIDNLGIKPEKYFTIDRINGTRNYEPGNIRWAAPLMQARNRRGAVKITEKSGLTLAYLYKYYKVSGAKLRVLYNDYIAEDDSHKISKSWQPIYNACQSYCPFV